eukprot:7737072-Pyramimonas_sp.AAC.1
MSKVVLSERQRTILDLDCVTIMRVYVAAAANRAAVVQEGDLPAKADIQANLVKVSFALYIVLKAWLYYECSKIPDMSKAPNIMTSRYACTWTFVKNAKGEMERTIRLRL